MDRRLNGEDVGSIEEDGGAGLDQSAGWDLLRKAVPGEESCLAVDGVSRKVWRARKTAVSELVKLLVGGGWKVRRNAALALGKLGGGAAHGRL